MLWLIQHLNFLEDGYWVPNQKESGYTNAPIGKGNVPDEAYFCKVKVITGDLTLRLKRTKEDSRTLVHEIQKLGVEVYEDLSPAAKVALNYISGWRRRKTSYKDFKARVR
uniref:Uncharacterized protein n=1 Tax=viral metagenome TaxID=1070528 RepID=A0A6M3KP63_9ZZZZ